MEAGDLSKEFNEVLFEFNKGIGRAILNRPRQLNSLTYEMISQMLKQLGVFEDDPTLKLVILKGNGRAFCAGGDVKGVLNFVTNGHWSFGASFFRRQLTLDYKIATYKKPVVSILDGIVMGGGAGLSMLSTFRIVTEKTIFAMPEAAIGLFPDCGASYFLSRIPGSFGEYLGLTGTRLTGMEMLACGLATHFVFSKDLASLEDSLDLLAASESMVTDKTSISRTISKFVQQVHLPKDSVLCQGLGAINECFSKDTVEEILASLEKLGMNQEQKWILKAVGSMKSASPTSLKIFLRLGARATLIERGTKPQWKPSKLELVSKEMVYAYFTEIENDEDWVSLKLPPKYVMVPISPFEEQYSRL
ncbi:OLC1v1012133C1 [Oldenlandia corymbosa var. corymbosa]|uniref:3-hydroxyisobutyryl-CoA hydrolase n=1 Tax=Oldenlandia corymbosa var. corymbosa TaxID=529605 RepID=A0AAV1DV92_OLDCO|nr:OLC1v1012133C1 [Oldenlandia corymbosa var. corymbosa]